MRHPARLAVLASALAMSACGGGGSAPGNGDGDTLGGGGSGNASITADRDAVALVGFIGGEKNTEEVHFTVTGLPSPVHVRAITTQPEANPTLAITSSTTATVTLSPTPNGTPVRAAGSLVLQLCQDVACSVVLATKAVPYTMTFLLAPSAPTAVTLQADSAPAEVSVAISPAPAADDLAVSVNPGATWLSAALDDAGVNLTVSREGLQAGTYVGTYRLAFVSHPEIVSDPQVSLTVQAGENAPAAVNLTLDAQGAVTTTDTPVSVLFAPGTSTAWSVSADRSWLALTQPAAGGSGTFGMRVDGAALQASGAVDGGTAIANVTVHAAGLADRTIPVFVSVQLPQITSVSPDTVPSNAAATLTITGRGLLQPGVLGALTLSGGTIASRSANSDTQATLVAAPLTAGAHVVATAPAAGFSFPGATVTAVDASAQAYAFVPDVGEKRSAIYDGPRGAIYAVGYNNDFLLRYRLSGGSWQVTRLHVAGIDELVMSRDGTTLYVTAGSASVLLVDPDTLAVRQTLAVPFDVSTVLGHRAPNMSTADGRLWLDGQGNYFDTAAHAFGNEPDFYPQAIWLTTLNAPPDGSALFIGITDTSKPPTEYVSATQSVVVSPGMPNVSRSMAFSTDGHRRIVDDLRVYDGSWTSLGSAEEIANQGSGLNSVVSPDGLRVYNMFYDDPAGANSARHIAVFNSSATVSGTTRLVEIGSMAVPDNATCVRVTSTWCDAVGTLMIDPTGETLYWLGGNGLVVLPIPSTLRARSATDHGLLGTAR